ncbi:MAG: hypothetical protein WA705_24595 [Candidatus Ozemobacteraceae bacterium]
MILRNVQPHELSAASSSRIQKGGFQVRPSCNKKSSVRILSLSRYLLWVGLLSFFIIPLPCPIFACDDSLLALLTADDPESTFSKGIRQFHGSLSSLGAALNAGRPSGEVEPLMTALMESWLAFSGKYMVNPPEKARNDPDWRTKMEDAADRIGIIRKAIAEKRISNAHDAVLDLSTRIGAFFDGFGLSPLKRSFLDLSRGFEDYNRKRLAMDRPGMIDAVASLSVLVATFTPLITSDSREIFQRLVLSVAALASAETNALAVAHLDNAQKDFQDLRNRLLLREWFPGMKTLQPLPQPNTSASATRMLITPASPTREYIIPASAILASMTAVSPAIASMAPALMITASTTQTTASPAPNTSGGTP